MQSPSLRSRPRALGTAPPVGLTGPSGEVLPVNEGAVVRKPVAVWSPLVSSWLRATNTHQRTLTSQGETGGRHGLQQEEGKRRGQHSLPERADPKPEHTCRSNSQLYEEHREVKKSSQQTAMQSAQSRLGKQDKQPSSLFKHF